MDIIQVKNLVKRYKKAATNAVDDISFSVKDGEFFAFLGPNGAGKTTTISVLTTTLAKTSGTILVNGYDVDKEPAKVRSQIGVIFQNPSLDLNLTAEENIRFHTVLYKMYGFKPSYKLMPKEYQDKVAELAEVLGLKDEIFKPIRSFSGGMKRKLEIIRTLIHKPKVLFLDEPTSGLDPLSRRNLWGYLKDIRKKENITIFLTTHYLEEADDADTICVINHGKMALIDSTENFKNRLTKDFIYLETKDLAALKNELTQQKYKFEEINKGLNVYTHVSNTQELLKNLHAEITNIKLIQPTLEEAYLDLIKNDKEEKNGN